MFANTTTAFRGHRACRALLALLVLAGALSAIGLGGSRAHAAQPNNQGCLGEDFSTYARYGSPGGVLDFEARSGFGQTNAWLAHVWNGLGGPIQSHLAGLTGDGLIVNSCNDPNP